MTDQQPVTETPPMTVDITDRVSAMDLLGIAPDAELDFARGAEVDELRERLAKAERERDEARAVIDKAGAHRSSPRPGKPCPGCGRVTFDHTAECPELAIGILRHGEQLARHALRQAERERDEARQLVRHVDNYGTGYIWRKPDGDEVALNPAEVVTVLDAAKVSYFEALVAERDILAQQLDDARALNACEAGEWERMVADRDAMRSVLEAVLAAEESIKRLPLLPGASEFMWLLDTLDAYRAALGPLTATQAGEQGAAVGQDGAGAQTGAEGVSVVP
jgi:hypothetical protein